MVASLSLLFKASRIIVSRSCWAISTPAMLKMPTVFVCWYNTSLVSISPCPSHTHALALKLEVGKEVAKFFGLFTELPNIAQACLFVFDQARCNLLNHVLVSVRHKETNIFAIPALSQRIILESFRLLIDRLNFFTNRVMVDRLKVCLQSRLVLLVFSITDIWRHLVIFLTKI